jgi:hypothetical protein
VIEVAHQVGVGPLTGTTTADDAVRLVRRLRDPGRYPMCLQALRNTLHASRIPLGADEADVVVAHKTGSLAGVAHDVAVLDCAGGTVLIAFLTDQQHDTLVAGYEMGICTRGVLQTWGLSVRHTAGLA